MIGGHTIARAPLANWQIGSPSCCLFLVPKDGPLTAAKTGGAFLAGYIVETAAEKRLRLASKALSSPVWLTRKIAEADGGETTMLASRCCLPPLSTAVSKECRGATTRD